MVQKNLFTNRRIRQIISIVIAVVLIGSVTYLGVQRYNSSHAATGASMFFDPPSGTVAVGDNLSVTIQEDSGSEPIIGAATSFTYDTAKLDYVGFTEGGVLTQAGKDKIQPGLFRVSRGTLTPVTGKQPIVTVTFKVKAGATGNIALKYERAYSAISRASDIKDILEVQTDGSYTVADAPPPPSQTIFTMVPATGTYKAGQNVDVALHVVSPVTPVIVVHPFVTYPADLLDYTGHTNAPLFPNDPLSPAIPPSPLGLLEFSRGIKGGEKGVKGDNLFVTLHFTVKASAPNATAPLAYDSRSYAYDGVTGLNILNVAASTGASYAIVAADQPPVDPPVDPPTDPPGDGGDEGDSGDDDSGTTISPPSGGATITTKNGHASIDGDTTVVSGQIELAPVVDSAQSAGSIVKVEYYLGDKLMTTITKAPYKYSFDTTKLRNGVYTVYIKTYYKDGTTDKTSTKLTVKNDVTLSYLLSHYGLVIIGLLLALIALGLVIWKYVLPRFRGGGDGDNGYMGSDPDQAGIVSGGDATTPDPMVVAPSSLTIDKPSSDVPTDMPAIVTPSSTPATPSIPPTPPAPKPVADPAPVAPVVPEATPETVQPATVIKPTTPAATTATTTTSVPVKDTTPSDPTSTTL